MNPPAAPPDPEFTKRALDFAEFGAKLVVALGAMWAFVVKIVKPYSDWRKQRLAAELREILKPELDRLERLGACADRIEIVLERQSAMFNDIDDFMLIARTNTERIDETNDLLDEVFHLDRRVNADRRKVIDTILADLAHRQQNRRRHAEDDVTPSPAKEPSP